VTGLHLTVIAKRPVPGRVKTRLCPPCTPEQAADVAAAALADTMDAIDVVAAGTEVRKVLLFEGDPDGWGRADWDVVAQGLGGLDRRLCDAFDELGPGLVVGMETPHAAGSLAAGIAALRRGSDAIGLTNDGGYWVIGLHRVDRRVFDDVPMSTSATGLAQLRALHRTGRSVERLMFARDLDTIDDLRAAATRSGGTPRLTAVAGDICATLG
jgi:uncharacterized protein